MMLGVLSTEHRIIINKLSNGRTPPIFHDDIPDYSMNETLKTGAEESDDSLVLKTILKLRSELRKDTETNVNTFLEI
ncbi:unnamed protein product [Bursaphelenchus xylophilus]|uniref:(pine wood nematode) hypothetical protein n=1 Tax=Bursaphelenchus xylophilus TaxID=6326 RepID=A0A7I8WU51_BURXY|nr:unnamed protein product [Bursaphelenchus xylophilus]CAG9116471.1 unnamed protein product [Bursaphelenchus xylophilus]